MKPIRKLYAGADNLAVMRGLNSASVDLIYLDPPFNSKSVYKGAMGSRAEKQQFSDIWRMSDILEDEHEDLRLSDAPVQKLIALLGESHGESWKAYLTFMAVRLLQMRRLLKNTGGIYLHCDSTMSAPLKLLMDLVFGQANFRNEIIWHYNNRLMQSGKTFARLNDVILWYSKGASYAYNPQMDSKWEPSNTQKRRLNQGWEIRKGDLLVYDKKKFADSGINPGEFKHVYWNAEAGQPPVGCVWSDIPIVNPMAKERVGWATQKPLALLERIIKASSDKGDLVMDPFCGCATACLAAENLGRQWLGIDIDMETAEIMKGRAKGQQTLMAEWDNVAVDARRVSALPRRSDIVRIDKKDKDAKTELWRRQEQKCAAPFCPNADSRLSADLMELDCILPRKRGGDYVQGNVQLLCPQCNRMKSAGTMAALNKKAEEAAKEKLWRKEKEKRAGKNANSEKPDKPPS